MQFRTEINLSGKEWRFGYGDPLLSMGSCFSENIGRLLEKYKFNILINPFGIVYNPASIARLIDNLVDGKIYTDTDVFQYNGIWQSYDFHSRFSHIDKNTALANMNESRINGTHQLQRASVLFITLGTSWTYLLRDTEEIVNNCHKVPASEFDRKLLSISEMSGMLQQLADKVRHLNPGTRIVWSVSPVRHQKDGLVENMWSKARLIEVCHTLAEPREQHFYFPGYELMMDDLRDYRYYDRSLVHPSALATEYIWDKFYNAYLNEHSRRVLPDVMQVVRNVLHRPHFETTSAYQQLLIATLNKIEGIEEKDETIDFEREKSYLQSKLK